jgi:hypothetical protein
MREQQLKIDRPKKKNEVVHRTTQYWQCFRVKPIYK